MDCWPCSHMKLEVGGDTDQDPAPFRPLTLRLADVVPALYTNSGHCSDGCLCANPQPWLRTSQPRPSLVEIAYRQVAMAGPIVGRMAGMLSPELRLPPPHVGHSIEQMHRCREGESRSLLAQPVSSELSNRAMLLGSCSLGSCRRH